MAERAPASAPRVAVIERRGKFLVAEPFFGRGPRQAVSRDSRYGVGDLVVLRPSPGRSRGGRGGGRAAVARRLGRPQIARDVIEALMVDRGLARRFEPGVERAAREAADRQAVGGDSEGGAGATRADGTEPSRRDLRGLATFTIDPQTARDYDDAISAAELGEDQWTVWVHIADVSWFVSPRSPVDREAYRRGTSVYAPGAVEPMLPPALSSEACSLVPGQDRLAVTVEMTIGAQGLDRASFYRSVIRSDARLEYDQVDRIFAGIERAGEPWGLPLASARSAAAALSRLRSQRAALVVDSAEPEFAFDGSGAVVAVKPIEQTESHRLIEHLMIAANEAVAGFLESRRVPALYRVHERPDGNAVLRLVGQLASLGVPTPPVPRETMTSQQAADLVGEISAAVDDWATRRGRGRRALTMLVLRTLKQAYYDHRNLGHAGLQSPRYCHFTSPIRRYPDLICHRALLSAIDGSEPAPDGAWVLSAGPWTSEREREAMIVERDADDVARCFLLERELAGSHPGSSAEVFEGEVVGVIGAGAFVAFGPQLSYQGMLPVRRLRGDWWELGEEQTMLVGTRSGTTIRLGDTIAVRVGSIDAPRGRVDLLPAADPLGED